MISRTLYLSHQRSDARHRSRTMTTQTTLAQIRELASITYMVATNEGTYGPMEAQRRVGSADPRYADRCEYETVGGERHASGCDLDQMPGTLRRLDRSGLIADRQRLGDLRRSQ